MTLKTALDNLLDKRPTRDGLVTISIRLQAVKSIYGTTYSKYYQVDDGCLQYEAPNLDNAINQALAGKHDLNQLFESEELNEAQLSDLDQLGRITKLELKEAA